MNEKMTAMKTAMVAALTTLGAFLGWKGVMLVAWVTVMLLDYLSGTMAACKDGQWCSATARQGLWHKGGMILVVTVSAIADLVMLVIAQYMPLGIRWPGIVLPLVLAWYILTELGSILENAVKLGANVPEWLVKLLKVGVQIMDSAGESVLEKEEN